MNVAVPALLLYSIVGAVVLVYVPYLVVAYGRFQVGMDIAAPRAMFDRLPPYAQRATWAHQNSFEALMIYAPAALMAYGTGVDSPWAAYGAIAFLVARLLFSLFYIVNLPLGRSLMFGIGSACSLTLYVLSLLTVGPILD
ncbi:MAG: MAPEG family protein [Spirulina sp. DLM2.Bin59]|nr:MAG: MAPEG family protein [Spirulina sp. DLM2.Bin59]